MEVLPIIDLWLINEQAITVAHMFARPALGPQIHPSSPERFLNRIQRRSKRDIEQGKVFALSSWPDNTCNLRFLQAKPTHRLQNACFA